MDSALAAPAEGRAPAVDPDIETMLEAGVHLGHVRSKRHPAMASFVWGVRNNVEIIDLVKTKQKLAEAKEFLWGLGAAGKTVLIVGIRPIAREAVRETAQSLGFPYVVGRWIGGTLTNFKAIVKRIETLEGLEQERATGGFEKYTKKERQVKEEEMARLRRNFDTLRTLRALPDAVLIVDISHDALALAEARRLGIPVVALTDTNTNPRLVTYPIPSNDDARPAVTYILRECAAAIREGREAGPAGAVPAEPAPSAEAAAVSPAPAAPDAGSELESAAGAEPRS